MVPEAPLELTEHGGHREPIGMYHWEPDQEDFPSVRRRNSAGADRGRLPARYRDGSVPHG
jgi:hypothetical protein